MTVGQPTPARLYERLLDQFIHYFDTAYELREPGLRQEVLDTLSIPGEVLQHPVLELLPIYARCRRSQRPSHSSRLAQTLPLPACSTRDSSLIHTSTSTRTMRFRLFSLGRTPS